MASHQACKFSGAQTLYFRSKTELHSFNFSISLYVVFLGGDYLIPKCTRKHLRIAVLLYVCIKHHMFSLMVSVRCQL